MKYEFKGAPANDRVYRLVERLDERTKAIIENFCVDFAHELLPVIASRAPDDIEGYPEMLKVRRYKMPGIDSVAGVVVPGHTRMQKLTGADASRTVIYVKPTIISGNAVDPSAVLLWEHNPWTMDTLPYEPKKRDAVLVARRVSVREVVAIEKQRMAERPSIDMQLRAAGITPNRKKNTSIERKVVRDLAFEVLRREFGVAGSPHVAHWRPALQFARTVLVKQVLKSYLKWLTVPSNRQWMRPVTTKAGKVSEVRRIQGFQSFIS